MKRLTLIRHAKSSWAEPSLRDFDRPLTRRGKDDAADMGRRLAGQGIVPDALITSPAKRARSTARRIARRIGFPRGSIREDERLYEAEAGTMLALARDFEESWGHVLLVGHNPGLTELANLLCGHWLDILPTAGVACLAFEVAGWPDLGEGRGVVTLFDSPKRPPRSA